MDKRTKSLCGIALVFPCAFFLLWLLYGVMALTSLFVPRAYDAAFMQATAWLPQMAAGESWLVFEHVAMCVPAVFALLAYRLLDLSYSARRLWLWLPLGLGLLNAVCLALSAALQSGLTLVPAVFLSPAALLVWFGQNIWLLRRAKTNGKEPNNG